MRIFHYYKFLLKTKLPFPQWPGIVHRYMQELGLKSKTFHYYFTGIVMDGSPNPCERAARENPQLGSMTLCQTDYDTYSVLTDIGSDSGCTEEDLLPLMPKLYRRYGFSDSYLLYQDVDFFGRITPAVTDPSKSLPEQRQCSSIVLYRDGVFTQWNCIELHIDITNGDEPLDATPYRDAMAALLPGIKYMECTELVMDPAEIALYGELNRTVQPHLQAAQDFFSGAIADDDGLTTPEENVPTGKILKKLCKKYGFTYVRYEYFVYFIQKRTAGGHYIALEVVAGRSNQEASPMANYKGLGFDLPLFANAFTPRNPHDAELYFDQLFSVILQAEQEVLGPLSTHFPPTPLWFIPID